MNSMVCQVSLMVLPISSATTNLFPHFLKCDPCWGWKNNASSLLGFCLHLTITTHQPRLYYMSVIHHQTVAVAITITSAKMVGEEVTTILIAVTNPNPILPAHLLHALIIMDGFISHHCRTHRTIRGLFLHLGVCMVRFGRFEPKISAKPVPPVW